MQQRGWLANVPHSHGPKKLRVRSGKQKPTTQHKRWKTDQPTNSTCSKLNLAPYCNHQLPSGCGSKMNHKGACGGVDGDVTAGTWCSAHGGWW
uniref:Uncharacterized protein n=1 Tax=Arundo donax TaxID=35708 RepID=A0A0A9F671_ARUDO